MNHYVKNLNFSRGRRVATRGRGRSTIRRLCKKNLEVNCSIDGVENGYMEVTMEEFWKLQEQIRQLTAYKSRLNLLMNKYKVLANDNGREALNKHVSIEYLNPK